MSALEEYEEAKFSVPLPPDPRVREAVMSILVKADAAIEQLKWMLYETWGQGGMEYGPPDFSEYMADLERRWTERKGE